jgi:hypothetical protein
LSALVEPLEFRYWAYRICAPRNSLNGFEKLRNSSMNTLAIGFGVRFRSVPND